jgi:hypothetical protein
VYRTRHLCDIKIKFERNPLKLEFFESTWAGYSFNKFHIPFQLTKRFEHNAGACRRESASWHIRFHTRFIMPARVCYLCQSTKTEQLAAMLLVTCNFSASSCSPPFLGPHFGGLNGFLLAPVSRLRLSMSAWFG